MNIDYRAAFNETIKKIKELGVERKFVDLGSVAGPENPEWISGKVIYEIYVRAFSEKGNFKGVTRKLPELYDYGIDIIWLMPIYPIGEINRKGKEGCPYSVRDYFTVNPEYGTEEDFKELVNRAHELGMKVLIDMVPNHVAYDYSALKENPRLITRNSEGEPMRKIAEWTDVVDLDYSNRDTWEHIAQVMRFWIQKFDIDGYRCDVAGMVPLDFWEWVEPKLRSLKPDLFLLAEWEGQSIHRRVFNSTYDWSTLEFLQKVFNGQDSPEILARWILTKTAIYPSNSLPLRFLENHDLARSRSVFPGEKLFPALTFVFTLHGVPLIYNGQETGAVKTPSLFEKDLIDWDQKDQHIYDLIKRLIDLRKKEPALYSKNYRFQPEFFKDNLLIFDKSDEIRVIINFNQEEVSPDNTLIPKINEIIFDTREEVEKRNENIVLMPYQSLIVKI